MSILRIPLTASFLLVLMGCGSATPPSTKETSPPPISTNTPQVTTSAPAESPTVVTPPIGTNTPQATTSSPSHNRTAAAPNSAMPGKNQLISAEGIGSAKVGMTLGALKKALAGKAEFKVKSPFIVDFDAIAVIESGKEQYYILYPAGSPLADSDVIEALVTDNPDYRTAEGVGPGTPIKQAEAVYGEATLSYNTLNESREYVKFAKLPSKAIAFRTKATPSQQLAGIYPSSKTEFKQTKEFQKTASIGSVEVYCRQNCPLPSP